MKNMRFSRKSVINKKKYRDSPGKKTISAKGHSPFRKHCMGIIALSLFVAAVVFNFTSSWIVPSDSDVFDMYLTIGDHVGFNIDTEALFFGTMGPGGSGMRYISIVNKGDSQMRVEFQASGELGRFVSVSSSGFVVAPGENTTVNIVAQMPFDTPYGDYTGKLAILYYK